MSHGTQPPQKSPGQSFRRASSTRDSSRFSRPLPLVVSQSNSRSTGEIHRGGVAAWVLIPVIGRIRLLMTHEALRCSPRTIGCVRCSQKVNERHQNGAFAGNRVFRTVATTETIVVAHMAALISENAGTSTEKSNKSALNKCHSRDVDRAKK